MVQQHACKGQFCCGSSAVVCSLGCQISLEPTCVPVIVAGSGLQGSLLSSKHPLSCSDLHMLVVMIIMQLWQTHARIEYQ